MIERSMGENSTVFGSPLHGPNLTAAGNQPTQRSTILPGIKPNRECGQLKLKVKESIRHRIGSQKT